ARDHHIRPAVVVEVTDRHRVRESGDRLQRTCRERPVTVAAQNLDSSAISNLAIEADRVQIAIVVEVHQARTAEGSLEHDRWSEAAVGLLESNAGADAGASASGIVVPEQVGA